MLGHNALDGVGRRRDQFGDARPPLWIGLHCSMFAKVVGPFFVINAYPVLPWIGVMLLGFGGVDDVREARARSATAR